MRLFVAVTPPPEALAAVSELVNMARGEHPAEATRLRWTDPLTWHVTLAFLGEVGPAQAGRLRERLARTAGRHAPMTLRLMGPGAFQGQILWLGVAGERDRLRRLAWSVAAAGRREGLLIPDRPYRPHLTLARARQPSAREGFRPHLIRQALMGFEGPPWRIDQVTLVRSHLGPAPRHETIGVWPLVGR